MLFYKYHPSGMIFLIGFLIFWNCDSANPTSQPSSQPSRQPSRQPSGQPLSQPSSIPSAGPSFNWKYTPSFLFTDSFSSVFYYFCQPLGYRSVKNMALPIFRGLSISTRVRVYSMKVWIEPFSPGEDIITPYNVSADVRSIFSPKGELFMTSHSSNGLHVSIWEEIIYRMTYKLNNDREDITRRNCRSYINGQHAPNIYICFTDIYGRTSASVLTKLQIETAAYAMVDGSFEITNQDTDTTVFFDDPTNNATYAIVADY